MNNRILVVLALDGQSSNHVMNTNILSGFKELGNCLDAVVINNYKNKSECIDECKKWFNSFVIIDGDNIEYGTLFYLKYLISPKFYKTLLHEIKAESQDKISSIEKYDEIISIASPIFSHVIAKHLIGQTKCNYIQYWSDPVTGSMLNFHGKIPFRRKTMYAVEKRIIKYSKKNVYGTKPLADFQKILFKKQSRLMYFCDVSCVKEYNEHSLKQKKSKYRIGYFGNFSSSIRNIDPLISASIEKSNSVELMICGDGDSCIKEKYANKVSINNDRVSYEEAHQKELSCDILVSVGNLRGCQIPGKTFYYAGINCPVIFIADGEYAAWHKDYLQKFDRYIICDNNQDSITKAINKAVNMINTNSEYLIPEQMTLKHVAKQIMVV